jgi:hypothetical protein
MNFLKQALLITIALLFCLASRAMESEYKTLEDLQADLGADWVFSYETSKYLKHACIKNIEEAKKGFQLIFEHASKLAVEKPIIELKEIAHYLPMASYYYMALHLAVAKVKNINLSNILSGNTYEIEHKFEKQWQGLDLTIYKESTVLTPLVLPLDYVDFVQNIQNWVNLNMYSEVSKTSPFFDRTWLALVLPFIPYLVDQPVNNIYLSYNELKDLPCEIAVLENIACLWLNNNSLTSLPESLIYLKQLKHLNLKDNCFKHKPTVLDSMPEISFEISFE